MNYMGHADNCTCAECYVRRQQMPPAPVAQPVHEQQTIELGEPPERDRPLNWPFTVNLKEIVPLPKLQWQMMKVLGAGRIDLLQGGAEIVAMVVVDMQTSETYAVWWDRNARVMRTQLVGVTRAQITELADPTSTAT